jgi:hypothetical protein
MGQAEQLLASKHATGRSYAYRVLQPNHHEAGNILKQVTKPQSADCSLWKLWVDLCKHDLQVMLQLEATL